VDHPNSIHKRAESAASAYSESLNNSSVELEVCFLGLITQYVEALIHALHLRFLGTYAQRRIRRAHAVWSDNEGVSDPR